MQIILEILRIDTLLGDIALVLGVILWFGEVRSRMS